ncbi:MAG: hypothetical protein IKS80_02730 [Bacteroidaceae bacterium]|nr:hypothetical protein [Bacteroidaceae bacterium]
MKRIILTLLLGVAQLSVVNYQLSIGGCAWAQQPYGYAPGSVSTEELSGLGGGINEFVQCMTRFDPSDDPALARMKGKKVVGVRCYLRAAYSQARQKRSAILASQGSVAGFIRTQYVNFEEGWNDVLFDEPVIIDAQPLFLGFQVYETIGTPYPIVAYQAATVAQSCYVNLAKKTWEEYTDRGTPLILALVEDDAAACFERTAYAQNTTHPQTVAPDRDFEGGLYVHNFTSEPIQSVEIAMQGEGAASPTMRTIILPEPLPAYGSTIVSAQLRAGTTESTTATWTSTVTKVNGQEAQPGRPGTTRLYVTYDNFIRTPLIEEFTSQRCVNCPQMAYFLEKALQEYEGDYVYVAHHSGFVEDVFTTQPDREILYVFGGYQNEYNPAIMYNRAILEGENQIIQGVRDMSPEPYKEALALAADMAAMAEVNIECNGNNVTVSGRVARDLVGKPIYLSCYLIEDGISTDKYPQMGMDDADAPSDLKDVFRHNGIILHYFTAEAIGDLLSTEANGSYSVTYPMVEATGFGGTARRLVAFVHKVNKDDPYDTYVLNAAEMYLDDEDGIPSIDNGQLTIDNVGAAIFDLSGRRVSNAHLPKGIYIVGGNKKVIIRNN